MRRRSVPLLIVLSLSTVAFLATQSSTGPRVWTMKAAKIQGQPAIEEGKQVGFYVWQDKEGVHVRWTTADKPSLFAGRIDLDSPLTSLTRIQKNGSGWIKEHGGRIIMFSSTTRGPTDGFDLVAPKARRLQIELTMEGKEPVLEQVFLGEKLVNPPGFPLIIRLR